LSFAFAQAAQ